MESRQCSLIRSNFESLTDSPDRTHALSNSFYSILFARHPETREYFPASMGGQRDRIVHGLAHIVDGLDRPDSILPLVRQLGREHRKHGFDPSRFACLTEALALAVEQANGDDWTRDLAESWSTALDLVTTAMTDAARADQGPAAWVGTVVEHRLLTDDIAVVRLRLDRPMDYVPGQYVSVQVPGRPRMWRYLSPATPADSTGDRRVPCPESVERLGQPVDRAPHPGRGDVGARISLGSLGDRDDSDRVGRARLMIASGTGIAPIRAQLMSMARRTDNTPVHVFYSGRFSYDLYDLTTLDALARVAPWLTVVPVVENAENPRWHTGPAGPQPAVYEAAWAGSSRTTAGGPITTCRSAGHRRWCAPPCRTCGRRVFRSSASTTIRSPDAPSDAGGRSRDRRSGRDRHPAATTR